jgi:hypothetical protein
VHWQDLKAKAPKMNLTNNLKSGVHGIDEASNKDIPEGL